MFFVRACQFPLAGIRQSPPFGTCECQTLNFVFMKVCNFLAFTGGRMAGGLVMMMFAPKKGEDMRRDIKEKLGDMKRHFENAGCCGKEGCDCKVEEKIVIEE